MFSWHIRRYDAFQVFRVIKCWCSDLRYDRSKLRVLNVFVYFGIPVDVGRSKMPNLFINRLGWLIVICRVSMRLLTLILNCSVGSFFYLDELGGARQYVLCFSW